MTDTKYSIEGRDRSLIISIVLAQIVTLYPLLGIGAIPIVSLLNYLLMTVATFYLVSNVAKSHLRPSFVQLLYFIWLLYIFISAIPSIFNGYMNYLYLKRFMTSFMYMYSIPLFMICSLNENFIQSLFRFIYILCLLYFVSLLSGWGLNEGTTMLIEGSIILIMTLPYHNSKKRIVVVIGCIVCIVFMMLAARRNKVVFFGAGMLMAFFINLVNSKKSDSKISLVFLIVALALGLFFTASYFSLFFERMGTGMSSREVVLDYFFMDFNSSPNDWITGRGMYGEFFGGVVNATDENTDMRDGIENGYLYLILKGGIVWVALLALISLRAIYLGYFKSRNLLCKGFAMIVLLNLVDMIGFGVPTTSIKYIMLYISIAGCNTEWLRHCSDEYLAPRIGLR